MNRWATMLAELPPTLQRLIARHNRVSLPRRHDSAERLARLRAALCRAATVRAVYATLEPEVRDTLEFLRHARGGLRPAEAARKLGPIRPLTELVTDPRPRSIGERLLLLGWLLPRPARPRNPAHLMLPPELRRWLPQPLALPDLGLASVLPPHPPADVAAVAILVAAAAQPLPVRADGRLSRSALARLRPRLVSLTADPDSLAAFAWALLCQLGLAATHRSLAAPTIAAQVFLALPPRERIERLRAAWVALPRPDAWATALRVDGRGLDWPLLRRRLLARAAALPAGRRLAAGGLHDALTAALGPLADAQTHGFRQVSRAPWQPRRARMVWEAALRGPLTWLGVLAWVSPDTLFRPDAAPAADEAPAQGWQAVGPDLLQVPHASADADLLQLAPHLSWHSTDADGVIYRLLTAPSGQMGVGLGPGARADMLRRRVTAAPPGWPAGVPAQAPVAQIAPQMLVSSADPVALDMATRSRSVRRHISARLAPGLATVEPARAATLARALERQGLEVKLVASPPPVAPEELSAGERAALLVACAFYRRHAGPDLPLPPPPDLAERLEAGLPPELRTAVNAALAQLGLGLDLGPTATPWEPAVAEVPSTTAPAALSAPQARRIERELTQAIGRGQMVMLRYRDADGVCLERTVRPIALRQAGGRRYLDAFCLLRGAERSFRLDRILALASIRSASARRTANQIVERIAGDLTQAEHLGATHGGDVEPVDAHAVGIAVD